MNERFREICLMFNFITGISCAEAGNIIKKTATGQGILQGNLAIIYEQQTENLYSIAEELAQIDRYKELASVISADKIVEAMNAVIINADSYTSRAKPVINNKKTRILLLKKRRLLSERGVSVC